MWKILQNYSTGMATYDRCHKSSIYSQWLAFQDEMAEFWQQPSVEEAWDVLHSAGRLVWAVTGVPLQLLAWPTVRKHGLRFAERGCIRSHRNCQGECCLSCSNGLGSNAIE